MGVEWGKIGQNNSHALRNVGSFEPAETNYFHLVAYLLKTNVAFLAGWDSNREWCRYACNTPWSESGSHLE
jgi:hypothetical protein